MLSDGESFLQQRIRWNLLKFAVCSPLLFTLLSHFFYPQSYILCASNMEMKSESFTYPSSVSGHSQSAHLEWAFSGLFSDRHLQAYQIGEPVSFRVSEFCKLAEVVASAWKVQLVRNYMRNLTLFSRKQEGGQHLDQRGFSISTLDAPEPSVSVSDTYSWCHFEVLEISRCTWFWFLDMLYL